MLKMRSFRKLLWYIDHTLLAAVTTRGDGSRCRRERRGGVPAVCGTGSLVGEGDVAAGANPIGTSVGAGRERGGRVWHARP